MLSLLIVIALAFPFYNAKADSKRMYLSEVFTSSSCAPCASFNPTFASYMYPNEDVYIPLKIHTQGPSPTDPMYSNNVASNAARASYYGISAVPTFIFNGATVSNDNIIAPFANIEQYKTATSPITLTVHQITDASTITANVKVASSTALAGKMLRIAIVEWEVAYTGTNGDPIHEWVMREMLPNAGGTALNVAAGASQDVSLTYTLTQGVNKNNLYVVAFVQDDITKEVLQAGHNLAERQVRSEITVVGDAFTKIQRSNTITKVFKVKNLSTFKSTFSVKIDDNSFIVDKAACKATLSKASVTLEPNASEDITLTIVSNDQAYFARILVDAIPTSTDKISRPDYDNFDVLTEDAKYAVYIGYGNSGVYAYASFLANSEYKKDLVAIPISYENILKNFPPVQFKLAVFAFDASNYDKITNIAAAGTISAIDDMLAADKRVLMTTEFATSAAFMPNNTVFASFKSLLSNKIQILTSTARMNGTVDANNSVTGITPFSITGLNSDPVGKLFGKVSCTPYIKDNQVYCFLSDAMTMFDPHTSIPMCYYDTDQTQIAGIRAELAAGKLAYLTFGFDAIKSDADRSKVFNGIVTWLLKDVSDEAKIFVSTSNIEFNEIKVGETASKNINITNTGLKPLKIDKIELSYGEENFAIPTFSGPVILAIGDTFNLRVVFTPKAIGQCDGGVVITSNAFLQNETNINLSGAGTDEVQVPTISVSSTKLNFDTVQVLETKFITITVNNTGNVPLNIESITLPQNDPVVFDVEEGGDTPYAIDPGQSADVVVSFQPTSEGNFTGLLEIQSTDPNNLITKVALAGKGYIVDTTTSVNDPIKTNSGNFTMRTVPNPMVNNGSVEFTVINTPTNVEMYVIDAAGKTIETIYNGSSVLGTINLPINTEKYSNGYYTIIANVNGEQISLPLIITK